MQHHGAHFFGAHAEANLARLVSTFPASCWILVLSTRRAQQWFERSRLPVLVSGHTYEGVALPSLDVNHRAGGRHAAALLARAGHTRIVVIRSQRRLPGLVEGELGFEEGFESATAGQGRIFPIIFNGNPASLALHLARVLNDRPAPTAVVTEEPNQYLTVLSALARLRLVVPGDLSVLSRLDDPFLEHLVPAPTRYRISPVTFARTLIRMAAHTAAGDVLPSRRRLIVPEFVPGGSVAPVPRSAASDGGDAT
jgi:DNA-binding LacI/PurR family transcriptional regulator